MPIIANTSLGSTFTAVHTQLNAVTKRMNQFAVNESTLYANTITANVSFVLKGSLQANSSTGTAGHYLRTSGTGVYWSPVAASGATWEALTSTNTAIRALVSDRLQVANASTLYATKASPTTSGLYAHTGRMTISTNLTVTGNTSSGPITSSSLTVTGSGNLPAQVSGQPWLTAGYGSPTSGKLFIGDGTGWNFYFSKRITSSTTDLFTFADSGNFTASGNVTAYSDEKLKTNITTIEGALALVEQMRGVRYNRIEDGKAGVGVIAQEMQQVLPEVVLEGDNLSVAYGNLVGVLIEAVKELSARVKELEAK